MKSMKQAAKCLVLVAGVALAAGAGAEETYKLEPNAMLRFTMPELPPTLNRMVTGKDDSLPRITIQLPENYTRDKEFPLFVFLHGGDGGEGLSLQPALAATGHRDAIAVNISLFKKTWDKDGPVGGLLILPEDYDTQSRAYRALLQKLLDAVPNITAEGSTFGGFSNGAHTTGLLLANEDPFLLEHFENFFMMEGGSRLLTAEVLQKPALRSHRFLTLMGDRGRPISRPENAPRTGPAGQSSTTRPGGGMSFRSIAEEARKAGIDYTSISMRGYGHEMPDDYLKLVGHWSRREPLPTPPPKPTTTPATAPTVTPNGEPIEPQRPR